MIGKIGGGRIRSLERHTRPDPLQLPTAKAPTPAQIAVAEALKKSDAEHYQRHGYHTRDAIKPPPPSPPSPPPMQRPPQLLDRIEFSYDPRTGRIQEEHSTTFALMRPIGALTSEIETLEQRQERFSQQGGAERAPAYPSYTRLGQRVQRLPQPRKRSLAYQYNALGVLESTTLPGGQTLNYLSYGSGHLHQINCNGQVITDIERDALHRETARSQGPYLHTQRLHDSMGRVRWQLCDAPAGDFLGRRAEFALNLVRSDPQDAWKHLNSPVGPYQERGKSLFHLAKAYRYDSAGELQARSDSLVGEQHYQYDALGRITQRSSLPRRDPRDSRDPSDALRQPPSSPNERPQVHYTGPGSIGRQREGNYSQGYRHTSEAFSEGYKTLSANEFFDWDRASNALPKENSRTPWAQGRVVNNRVVVWQDLRYEYDALGRMTQKEKGAHIRIRLHWNCENQLIRSQGQSDTVYHYDALGRRIAKEDRFACTWFVWSGMRLQQEERGERVQTWVYESAEADEAQSYVPLARIEHGFDEQKIVLPHVQFLHTNSSGAPEELTSHQGDVLWQARYKVWGNLALEEWRENVRNYAFVTPEQNLRFQGQYADAETGLHYNTFRYYDPDIGRFASQDPIGLAGGVNLYQYAPNPIGWIDPWGWKCGPTLPRRTDFNRGGRNFHLEQGTAKSGWKHIFDRHIDPIKYPGKSKFNPKMTHDDVNGLLGKTLKHGKESSYAGKSVFEARLKYDGQYKNYRATVNADGSVQTFHPLD